jgi:hypothetical protein
MVFVPLRDLSINEWHLRTDHRFGPIAVFMYCQSMHYIKCVLFNQCNNKLTKIESNQTKSNDMQKDLLLS